MEQAQQAHGQPGQTTQYAQGYGQARSNPNQAVGQYLNQLNYVNQYNQNQLYQQQYQMEAQNQQMNDLMQEQDDLRRQLNHQRQAAAQARQKPAGPSSRQKEFDALALLNNFQKSLGGDRSDPFSIFDNNAHTDSRRDRDRERGSYKKPSYNDFPPPSRDRYERPPPSPGYRNYPDQGGHPYGGHAAPYTSPFQSAANQLMSPMSPASYPMGFNPYQNMYQQPIQSIDPYTGLPVPMGYPPEKKKESSKTAEILMASLEKQNMILAELTGSINKDRDYKVTQEAKEIENKIRQLEFESQAKQYQLLSQNTADSLSKNYNRPIHDVELQKNTELMPGMAPNVASPMQLLQLQALMGGNRFMPHGAMPPVSVMPSEFMHQQDKIRKLKEKQKKKDKKKKHKLQELLLLLGLDDNDDEEPEEAPAPAPDDKKEDKTQKKKQKQAVDKALAEERAKQDEEKRKIDAENNKKRRKRQLQALMWTRLYPIMYYVDFYERKGVEREQVYSGLSERIGVNQDNAKNWASKAASKGFDMIATDKKMNLALVAFGGKKINQKDLDARPAEIQKVLKALLDGLINNTRQEIVPSQLLSFLGDISHDYCYPPQVYLFNFEINRLSFTHNASLKDTSLPKVQMICAFFILIRVLIAEMLLHPSKVTPTLKETDTVVRNVKTLASILVIIIVDYLRSRVVVLNGNQNHLDPELKVKPRSTPIAFIPPMELKDDADDEEGSKKKKDDQEIVISGLYTKEQLITYFQKKPLVDEIKALVEGWCNAIGEIVTNQHQDEVKDKKKNR